MLAGHAKQRFFAVAAVVWCASVGVGANGEPWGRVAIAPVVYSHGSAEARQTAVRTISEMLQTAGLTVLPYAKTQQSWISEGMRQATPDLPVTQQEADQFGHVVHARYVVGAVVGFSSTGKWVGFGSNVQPPVLGSDSGSSRTDSRAQPEAIAWVDISIRDAVSGGAIFTRIGVTARSGEGDPKSDMLQSPLLPSSAAVDASLREHRAVQIAVLRAMRDLVLTHKR